MDITLWDSKKEKKLVQIQSKDLEFRSNGDGECAQILNFTKNKFLDKTSKIIVEKLGKIEINARRDDQGNVSFDIKIIDYVSNQKQNGSDANWDQFKNRSSFFKIIKSDRFQQCHYEKYNLKIEKIEGFSYLNSKLLNNHSNLTSKIYLNKRNNLGLILENEKLKIQNPMKKLNSRQICSTGKSKKSKRLTISNPHSINRFILNNDSHIKNLTGILKLLINLKDNKITKNNPESTNAFESSLERLKLDMNCSLEPLSKFQNQDLQFRSDLTDNNYLQKHKNYFEKIRERHGEFNQAQNNSQQFLYLKKLNTVLRKVFLCQQINEEDVDLSRDERIILKTLLSKKKFPLGKKFEITMKSLNKLRTVRLVKKNEDMLKFIIKKCIRHMQTKFLYKMKRSFLQGNKIFEDISITEIKKNKDKFFYKYYFEKISKEHQIPIEKFYHFRSWKNRFLKNIPKSVTKNSLYLWKKNPEFIQKMIHFIRHSLKESFFKFNESKIIKMVSNWEKTIETFGREKGMKNILSKFKQKGSKLPWTLSEVESAIGYTLENLT